MKTIFKGVVPPPRIKSWIGTIQECKECKSRFELEYSDEVSLSSEASCGCLFRTNCPTCNSSVFFNMPSYFMTYEEPVKP